MYQTSPSQVGKIAFFFSFSQADITFPSQTCPQIAFYIEYLVALVFQMAKYTVSEERSV